MWQKLIEYHKTKKTALSWNETGTVQHKDIRLKKNRFVVKLLINFSDSVNIKRVYISLIRLYYTSCLRVHKKIRYERRWFTRKAKYRVANPICNISSCLFISMWVIGETRDTYAMREWDVTAWSIWRRRFDVADSR